MQTKTCTRCRGVKSIDQFFRTGYYPSGKEKRRGNCKECAAKDMAKWRKKNRTHYNEYMGYWRTKNPDRVRFIDIKRHYGLSEQEYLKMLSDQNGVCKICKKSPTGKRPLAIDHCHSTGRVRGILCYRCNAAVGVLDKLKTETLSYLSQ